MNDFDALLNRSFAEAHDEPADDGFAVKVSHAVAMRERGLQIRNAAYTVRHGDRRARPCCTASMASSRPSARNSSPPLASKSPAPTAR